MLALENSVRIASAYVASQMYNMMVRWLRYSKKYREYICNVERVESRRENGSLSYSRFEKILWSGVCYPDTRSEERSKKNEWIMRTSSVGMPYLCSKFQNETGMPDSTEGFCLQQTYCCII